MDFLDSLFEKIPIIRDMDKKKRMLAAGFVVFAVVSILGILIDAIANAGGVVALISVAIGFLLMAAIIIADFVMSKQNNQAPPPQDEQYDFFEDSPDDFSYQDESYGYHASNAPPVDDFDQGYDDGPYGQDLYDDDYQNHADSGMAADYADPHVEYEVQPDPRSQAEAPRRFGGVFHRGQVNENTAISDRIAEETETDRRFEAPARASYEAFHEETEKSPLPETDRIPLRTNFGQSGSIGEPVMTFQSPSSPLREEVASTADFVAPGVVMPPKTPDVIGGPVMSIPYRGGYQPDVTRSSPYSPAQQYPVSQPVQQAYPPLQQTYGASAYGNLPATQNERGQEIEEFFDHMSEEELLYSDCVEVWASDAKPAAIRFLKLVESMRDKKMADSLGREAEYVNAMLDRIYYFTMLDSIKENLDLKKYNFSAVVKECLRRFSPFFMEKRIGLLWKGLDIDIITDKRWLIFALTQVVFNAVEFTGLGGKIAISAKKEGSLIHLMVDDSGCGISDEDLPHIFMAGFMGDNVPNESGRRTGMGLFITRSVVEKLGGTVTAESTVGKGTRVTIILPERP